MCVCVIRQKWLAERDWTLACREELIGVYLKLAAKCFPTTKFTFKLCHVWSVQRETNVKVASFRGCHIKTNSRRQSKHLKQLDLWVLLIYLTQPKKKEAKQIMCAWWYITTRPIYWTATTKCARFRTSDFCSTRHCLLQRIELLNNPCCSPSTEEEVQFNNLRKN